MRGKAFLYSFRAVYWLVVLGLMVWIFFNMKSMRQEISRLQIENAYLIGQIVTHYQAPCALVRLCGESGPVFGIIRSARQSGRGKAEGD